jgi:hypothetical protein
MNVEAFAICDAVTHQGGKINLIGLFDEVFGPAAPIPVNCGIAGRIRLDENELGRKTVTLRLRHADGTDAFLASTEIETVNELKPNGLYAIQFALPVPNLILPQFGRYTLELLVNDEVLQSLPLHATQQQIPEIGPRPEMVAPAR